MSEEQAKIDQIFRDRQSLASKYSFDIPGNRFNQDILLRQIREFLDRSFHNVSSVRMLDLGAGELFWVEQFVRMGLNEEKCFGADLLLWRMKAGRDAGRRHNAATASAAELPFADESFDLITQFVMMTSITDLAVRRGAVAEIKRVLRPGGFVLWHDFRVNNPSNPHTLAIGKKELYGFFENWPIACRTTTLLPPLARKIRGKLSPLLKLFYLLPILRTHYLAMIGPKG